MKYPNADLFDARARARAIIREFFSAFCFKAHRKIGALLRNNKYVVFDVGNGGNNL